MGFSPWGLVVAIAVLAPNLLLLVFPPREPLPRVTIPGTLQWIERAGQGLCLVVPVITEPWGIAAGWAIPGLMALCGYYALWVRYLVRGRDGAMLYHSVARVPVPMAILPVVVFLAAAAWLVNPWIAVAAIVLAAGHIPAALLIARAT